MSHYNHNESVEGPRGSNPGGLAATPVDMFRHWSPPTYREEGQGSNKDLSVMVHQSKSPQRNGIQAQNFESKQSSPQDRLVHYLSKPAIRSPPAQQEGPATPLHRIDNYLPATPLSPSMYDNGDREIVLGGYLDDMNQGEHKAPVLSPEAWHEARDPNSIASPFNHFKNFSKYNKSGRIEETKRRKSWFFGSNSYDNVSEMDRAEMEMTWEMNPYAEGESLDMDPLGLRTPAQRRRLSASSSGSASSTVSIASKYMGIGKARYGYYLPVLSILCSLGQVVLFLFCLWNNNWEFAAFKVNPMFGPEPKVLLSFGTKLSSALIASSDSSMTLQGDWWRLLTSIFLPAGILQLLFNSLVLLSVGRSLESLAGSIPVLVVYLTTGIFGTMISSLVLPADLAVTSTAPVLGLVAAQIVRYFKDRHNYCGDNIKEDEPALDGFRINRKRSDPASVEGSEKKMCCTKSRCLAVLQVLTFTFLGLVIGTLPLTDNYAHVAAFLMGFPIAVTCVRLERSEENDFDHRLRRNSCLVNSFLISCIGLTVLGLAGAFMLLWTKKYDLNSNNWYKARKTDIVSRRI